MLTADVRLAKVMSDGLVGIYYDGDFALWSRVTLRKPNVCAVTGRELQKGEQAFAPIGNQMYRARRIGADVIASVIQQQEESKMEKQVLVQEGLDVEGLNLQPIHPGDAKFKPGEKVRVVADYDMLVDGDEGVVSAVGYAGGLYDAIVCDVVLEGNDPDEGNRIPQELLESA